MKITPGQGEDDRKVELNKTEPGKRARASTSMCCCLGCRRETGLHSGVLALIAPQWLRNFADVPRS